jgi:hypothetical protein
MQIYVVNTLMFDKLIAIEAGYDARAARQLNVSLRCFLHAQVCTVSAFTSYRVTGNTDVNRTILFIE